MRLLTYACVTDTVILLLRSKRDFAVTEIMSKRITLREACSQLAVQEDDLNIDNDDNLEEFFPGDKNDEEDEERVATVDDEETLKCLKRGMMMVLMKKPPLMKPSCYSK